MNSKVWPELRTSKKLGNQIMEEFIDRASRKELAEKIWATIKLNPNDEDVISDILYMMEYIIGNYRCKELYANLKNTVTPFRTVITFKNSDAILYLDVNGKFTDRENECAQFAENDEACCFLENSTEKCSDLFDVIAGTLSWHLEEFKDGTWVEVEPDDEFPD
jgi:hypothetical protein